MRNHARKAERDPELPPCEQAQADGVPCTVVGRRCEVCERAHPAARPQRPGDERPLIRRP
jgi:hypothetical protein